MIELLTIILWWLSGGFDWYTDLLDCMNYINLCSICEFFIECNVDYATLERWQFSMVNKYHEYLYPYNVIYLNQDYFFDFWEMMQWYTSHKHEDMCSSYPYQIKWILQWNDIVKYYS